MKHKRFSIKIICFVMITLITLNLVDSILIPKYLYDNTWPTTQTYLDFYKLQKDSIDVLFLGSSHCAGSFSPLQLYESYGISSFNLGCEQQNLLISYYWLREALRFQTPQVVVLDTYMLFTYSNALNAALNSAESTQRKAMDYMKWSAVKIEAIAAICENDENQSQVSYYLPNIRFHTRWSELNEDDFTYLFSSSHWGLMGFSAHNNYCNITTYEPFQKDNSTEMEQSFDIMEEYLDKIVQLCEDNDIGLILVNTPSTVANVKRYNFCDNYATEHGLLYIDFNEESVYSEIDYDFQNDNYDYDHPNIWGATKITDYIGRILINKYEIFDRDSTVHEELLEYYHEVLKDCELRNVTDFLEYLDNINDPRYAIFISIKGDGAVILDDTVKEQLLTLGITMNFIDFEGYSYYAVINGDHDSEELGNEELTSTGTLRNGNSLYEISSAGDLCGNKSSIIIDGVEYSLNQRGINIVIYCLDGKKVIDQVCFDTHEGLKAIRN